MAEVQKVYNKFEDALESHGIKHITEEEAMAMASEEPEDEFEETQEIVQEDAQPETVAEVQEEEPQAPTEEVITEEKSTERSFKFGQNTVEPEAVQTIDEGAILKAISDRLGETFSSFEEVETRFKAPATQSVELDAELEMLAKFKQETGRGLEDYMLYQSLNTAEMDDLNAVRLDFQVQYPELSAEEREDLISNKYHLDEDVYEEREVRVAKAQLKADAVKAKREIEKLRSGYTMPKPSEAPAEKEVEQSIFDEKWFEGAAKTIEELDAIEFTVGKDESFKFGIEDSYKQKLNGANKNIESYFDQYVNKDGSWNHELFNAHKAAIDNIELIVKEAYNQGVSKGQMKVLAVNSNANPEPPRGGGQRAENEHKKALEEIFSGPPRMRVQL